MRDFARQAARRRRRRTKLALAFYAGLASGALIALVTRAMADERAGFAPFAAHAARHATMVGLFAVAAALVAVAVLRRSSR